METLIESIRAAMAASASDETRVAGAHACRTILTVLEAKRGEPMTLAQADATTTNTEPPPTPLASEANPSAAIDPAQIANMVCALGGIPVDQLLDLAIARMRAALPKGAEVPRVEPVKFHIVHLPPVRK